MASFLRNFNNPFIAFKNRNFRYYWFGWMFSLIGTWMQNIAQPWLAYKLTNSPFLLSLVATLQFLPMLFLSLFAGVLLDRFSKRKVLLITQSCLLVITMAPAILIWKGQIQYWHLLVLAALMGIVNSIDMPARQSFVVEMVGKDNTLNAVSLTSATFNTARIVGPAIAGITMSVSGPAWCFFINSLSFGALLLALAFIKPAWQTAHRMQSRNIFVNIKEGLLYVRNDSNISKTLLIIAIVATFGMNHQVIVPVFTKVVLKGQEAGFGFMMSCIGAGSLFGALGVATMSKNGPQRFNLQIAPIIVGVIITLISFIPATFYYYAICLFILGFFFVSFSSSSNSNIQMSSSNEYRGRVMSIYAIVFSGSTPLGSLYAGFFTDHFGPRAGYFACGVMILFLISIVMLVRLKRQVTT
jgi:MFS family permease